MEEAEAWLRQQVAPTLEPLSKLAAVTWTICRTCWKTDGDGRSRDTERCLAPLRQESLGLRRGQIVKLLTGGRVLEKHD